MYYDTAPTEAVDSFHNCIKFQTEGLETDDGAPYIIGAALEASRTLYGDCERIVNEVWDEVHSRAQSITNDSEAAHAYGAITANPEDFGHYLAYKVMGANAGFTESEYFHKQGVADHLNATAKALGYTGLAEVDEQRDGIHLVVAKHK